MHSCSFWVFQHYEEHSKGVSWFGNSQCNKQIKQPISLTNKQTLNFDLTFNLELLSGMMCVSLCILWKKFGRAIQAQLALLSSLFSSLAIPIAHRPMAGFSALWAKCLVRSPWTSVRSSSSCILSHDFRHDTWKTSISGNSLLRLNSLR
jgi:hypothetical protein